MGHDYRTRAIDPVFYTCRRRRKPCACAGLSKRTPARYHLLLPPAGDQRKRHKPRRIFTGPQFTTAGPGLRAEASAAVAAESATLDATVDPNAAPTTYYFQ